MYMPRRQQRASEEQPRAVTVIPEREGRHAIGTLNLHKFNVEGKASCWLFAVLFNIQGALAHAMHPTVRDRMLDYYMRKQVRSTMWIRTFRVGPVPHAFSVHDMQYI